jgi:MFS family permease
MRDTGRDDGNGLPERRHAVAFIVFIGVVSLFGDMTYEGARSVTGPFLGTLGASATLVGFVAGFGELVGYVVRFASGWFGDRTRRYWAGAIVGYALNLGSVPLLAIAGSSGVAAALMIGERMGRAIRSPLRDAMLSHAASRTGLGWGFGLHESLDQTGAVIGPLLVSLLLALTGAYRVAFAMLAIPATMSLILLLLARRQYPRPQDLEPLTRSVSVRGFAPGFWPYTAAGALIGAGYVDFALVAYHFGQSGVMAAAWIPICYAIAMAAAGAAALALGWLFDRWGIAVVAGAAAVAAVATPLVFLGDFGVCLAGVVLWGLGMGAQDSVLKAAVGHLVPRQHRATGYGTFDTARGVAWFVGSLLLGFLYDRSITAVVIVSLALQLLAVPVLLLALARRRKGA